MDMANSLPQIYQSLLPIEFLKASANVEKATCGDCFMADPQRGGGRYFKDLKCCTYYPFIPNYLVGEILKAGGEGANRLRKLIELRQYVLPIGVVPPPSYRMKMRGRYAETFGRDPAYLCPFYLWESGGCGIWKNRNSQCSTFFCAYDEAGPQESHWAQVQESLHHLELSLSQWCLIEKGYTAKEVSTFVDLLSDKAFATAPSEYRLDAVTWKNAWIHHLDDIEGFYLACSDIVQHKGKQYLHEDETWTQDKKQLLMNFPNLKTGKIAISESFK